MVVFFAAIDMEFLREYFLTSNFKSTSKLNFSLVWKLFNLFFCFIRSVEFIMSTIKWQGDVKWRLNNVKCQYHIIKTSFDVASLLRNCIRLEYSSMLRLLSIIFRYDLAVARNIFIYFNKRSFITTAESENFLGATLSRLCEMCTLEVIRKKAWYITICRPLK